MRLWVWYLSNKGVSLNFLFFYCAYTLVMRCRRISGIKLILMVLNFCTPRFCRVHHSTLFHYKILSNYWSRGDLSCLKFRWNLPAFTWVWVQVHLSDANFLYEQPTLNEKFEILGRGERGTPLCNFFLISNQHSN